jgi:hypothetical protein
MNATEAVQTYRISVTGLPGLAVASSPQFEVGAAESRWVAVRVQLPYDAAAPGSHAIHCGIEAVSGDARVSEKSVFIVPR